jgi:Mlc titration factor MtfA (ptsG expression regulator)
VPGAVSALFDAQRIGSHDLREYRLLTVLVTVCGMVALAAIPNAPRWLVLGGPLLGLAYYVLASQRERRRLALVSAPFPTEWREVLWRRVPHYSLLTADEQGSFEREIQVFLGEQRIYALGGDPSASPRVEAAAPLTRSRRLGSVSLPLVEVSDEQRLLVAASAAILLVGRPEWRLPTARDIVIYPTAFAEETYALWPDSAPGSQHAIGMVHAHGPILFSLDALERSFPHQGEGRGPLSRSLETVLEAPAQPHVGLHEFAHVIDFIGAEGRAGGLPGMVAPVFASRWHERLSVERERLLAGKSILNPYGLKSDAELFAVAVESFFQDALRMRVYHPELYGLLAEFFNQDPASRLLAHHATFIFRPWFAIGPTERPLA